MEGRARGAANWHACECNDKEGGPQVISNQRGFTLIELMIAMTLSAIAMGLIYNSYRVQQLAYTNDVLAVDMQQNARSTLALLQREIRMANYNPWAWDGIDNVPANGSIDQADPAESSGVRGFLTVRSDRLNFTLDLSNNGEGDGDDLDAGENITYRLAAADDADGDGIADAGAAVLMRDNGSGTGLQPLAFDVHAIAFAYAFDADGGGALDTYPNQVVVWAYDSDGDGDLDRHLDTNMDGTIDENDAAGGEDLPGAIGEIDRSLVRAVQVWLLVRSQTPMKGHGPTAQTFVVGPHHIVINDGFKRCLLNNMVALRNP
jgi:type IV pilus assembly protein PilW